MPATKMSRLGIYAVVSTTLAAGVIVSAFHQRPNFYSACVYLSQSNLCLMILINLILLIYATLVYGLQRLCYGPLRSIETEQLYEKGWFAVTETCLAMTIFREEVGAWFLVMFVALLTGKVWGWIGDGRVEVLEQQPPANPRLFHIRLSVSLIMSLIYDAWLMRYTINTVVQQARPNMMVMFLFEFAVLMTSSMATASRYVISLQEARIVKKQTQERLDERRQEVREERAELIRQREAARSAGTGGVDETSLPSEDDVDELDIEVQGWEAKGQWVLTLDLITDFLKLAIYLTFFIILMVFYGLPIHIIRDLVMTLRSFIKRLTAFLRYRRATQNMNSMYGDATAEDIQREDTCIICREEMRPWATTNPQAAAGEPAPRTNTTVNERQRPKKLPCGHILHLGCLKSWLERQQACPTCRAPVVTTTPAGAPVGNNGAPPPGILAPGQPNNAPPAAPQQRPRMRMFNLGPLRIGLGQGNLRDVAGAAAAGQQVNHQGGPRIYGLELGFPGRGQAQAQPQAPAQHNGQTQQGRTSGTIQAELAQLEIEISTELRRLQLTQQQLQLINLLQMELGRLRTLQTGQINGTEAPANHIPATFPAPHFSQQMRPISRSTTPIPTTANVLERHSVRPGTVPIPSGSNELPPGLTIPEGWSLLPLHREGGLTFPIHGQQPQVNGGLSPAVGIQVGHVHQPIPVPPPAQVPLPIIPTVESASRDVPSTTPSSVQPSLPESSTTSAPPLPSLPRAPAPAPTAATAIDTPSIAPEPSSSTAQSTQSTASNWKWDDDNDSDEEESIRVKKSELKQKVDERLKQLRAEEKDEDDDEEEDDDEDDEDEEDEESDGSEEQSTPKKKGKAVSVEDVDDEDA